MMAAVVTAEEQRDALVGRLFEATLGAFDLLAVYLGDLLGLYRALAEHRPSTSGDLAKAAGIHERYAREWLEQQAMGEILTVDNRTRTRASAATPCPTGTTRRCSTRRA
jgi:hypothetical protein